MVATPRDSASSCQVRVSSRHLCLAKFPTYSTKRCIELGESLHLMTEPTIPQRFEPRFFGNDSVLEAIDFFIAEEEFLLDCGQLRRYQWPSRHGRWQTPLFGLGRRPPPLQFRVGTWWRL